MSFVSPHIAWDDWFSGKYSDIDVAEDQLEGWVFAQALSLSENQHAGIAILSLVTPYFEVLTSYRRGEDSKDQSTTFLKEGLEQVFPGTSPTVVSKYVSEVRHGLMHELMFRNVIIHHGTIGMPWLGLDASSGILCVDPWYLLGTTHNHFRRYFGELRAGSDAGLLANFHKFMAIRKAR